MALTLTTYDSLLKRRYSKDKLESLIFSDRPLLAMLSKDSGFSGSALSVPLIYGAPQGLAAKDLASAQNAATSLASKNFLITIGEYFASCDISNKVMLASRDQPGAFISSKTAEIDALYEQLSDVLHQLCWGNGGGAIGQRSSLAGNIVTLTDPAAVWAFEVGMPVRCSAADGSGGADALRAGSTTVASVDPVNGKVTLTNAAALVAFADADYLFRGDDFAGATSTALLKGVQAYITATDTPANLWGMVRTDHPTRLAGCRVASADLSGKSIEDRIKTLGSRMSGRYKAKLPTAGFLNPEDWQTLEISLNSRGVRTLDNPKDAKFGFGSLACMMGGSAVPIYADRGAPKGTFFGLRTENWTLWSMLELIHPVNGDGLTMLRKSTTNDYEYRLESFPQLVTNAPLFNGRCPLT